MNYKNLIIINNEKIFKESNNFYCNNLDLKILPEELNNFNKVQYIVRSSNKKKNQKINLKNIKPASNIFKFIYFIYKTFKISNPTYLIVCITPYTFISFLLLFIFRKKVFVYLRSNGYEEYKAILGFIGPIFYHIMYTVVTFKSNIITCQKNLTKKKSTLISPSELDINWTKNTIRPLMDKPRLLYVGRMRIEKGVFSLFEIFGEITIDVELSIVGKTHKLETDNKKINFLNFENNISNLIKIYDNHNILILPSFTEAHPKVVDEALARERPVIIFEDLNQKIQNRQGIFVSKRNADSLSQTIEFIMKNYLKIQEDIKKNILPTKQEFVSQMTKILS